jgi:bacteriophage N4 adsorption protein B
MSLPHSSGSEQCRSDSGVSAMIEGIVVALDAAVREVGLFAAVGFAIGGIDDLAVDLLYLLHRLVRGRMAALLADDFAAGGDARPIAVFVPAWDEAGVIGPMLETALARYDYPAYRLYVGVYPNDPATIAEVDAVAVHDARVRVVVGMRPGPTTKADCLNTLWRALLADEAGGAAPAGAIVLHDAEDAVHRAELAIFDRLTRAHWVVQLPVLPLVDRGARMVSGHYADEFAEAHAKQLVMRRAVGAALPLAGTGCALARAAIDAVAAARGGAPFDPDSLTEDYELGLHVASLGGRGILARVREHRGGPLVAVRAYFPATLEAAVRQKARWMVGIALAGWDRVGWGRPLALAEHWMRMRDRRAPLATLVLLAAYATLLAWALVDAAHWFWRVPIPPLAPGTTLLLTLNAALLGWRLAMRMLFVGRAYGLVEALWSVPRMLVGNLIALLAARRALVRYVEMLRGAAPAWDKTRHVFPEAHRLETS